MLPDHPYEVLEGVPFTVFNGVGNSKLYLVHCPNEWEVFYSLLMKQPKVACDTETSGFRFYEGHRIVGLSFGWRDTHFYIPVRHMPSLLGGTPPPQLDMADIREDLRKFFAQKEVFTIWHNFKFDRHAYRADRIEIQTPAHDTVLLWKLVDESAPAALKKVASGWKDEMGRWHKGLVHKSANDQEARISKWRGDEAKARRDAFKRELMDEADDAQTRIEYQDLKRAEIKKHLAATVFKHHPYKDAKKADVHYGMVPIDMMCEYAGLDTFLTWKLYEHAYPQVASDKQLAKLYLNELALSTALFDAEETGVLVDLEYLETLKKQWEQEIQNLTKSLTQEDRLGDINLNSTDQLIKAFQETYDVSFEKKTASGKLSIDKSVLKDLAKEYTEAQDILTLREMHKLKSTYVDGILEKAKNSDGILYCTFNQNVATGRMSSTDPNLQNIPSGNTTIRRAFIRPKDYIYVFADYSQVEVRLTAHFSKDPLLLDAYNKGQDIHLRTACEMFNVPVKEGIEIYNNHEHPRFSEIKRYRSVAKTINFGIIYGVGASGLAGQISRPEEYKDISEEAWIELCQSYIDAYLEKYRGVKKFIIRSNQEIKKNKKIRNYFGRTRHLPHVDASRLMRDPDKKWMESRALRQGVNFVVQGTAADVFKTAVVRVHSLCKGKKSKLVNFVHDEIQLYIHKDEFDLLYDVKKAMEDFDFEVPLLVDFEFSDTNWAEKKEMSIEEAAKCYL